MPPRVSLFVTCLADVLFPNVAEDTVRILRRVGVQVEFPKGQTCCGQPAFNSGFRRDAAQMAQHFLEVFAEAEAIVTPSGSCAAMVKREYLHLFPADSPWYRRAHEIAGRTYELSQFLVQRLGVSDVGAAFTGKVTWHDSCHLNRVLGVHDEPRKLLRAVRGLELVEMERSDWCCGFGGTFAVRLPEISTAMMQEKIKNAAASGAQALVTGDASCMMHIAGGLRRQGINLPVVHLAQILAGDLPAIVKQ
ncbi:MAG: (Fe-S)-binding protein [Anaerolineae bacterium]|nr:(Fe-S)-binding protein [Anaerolineae bacterium]